MTSSPRAVIDDGRLDAVLVSPKGIIGWLGVLAAILTRSHRGHRRLEFRRFTEAVFTLEHSQELELDGDPIGPAGIATFRVLAGALAVRVA